MFVISGFVHDWKVSMNSDLHKNCDFENTLLEYVKSEFLFLWNGPQITSFHSWNIFNELGIGVKNIAARWVIVAQFLQQNLALSTQHRLI